MEIVLYTDGLLEAFGEDEEDKLNRLIEQLNCSNEAEMAALVQDEITRQNSGEQKDDICLVSISTKSYK
ncbi:Stage II sporulation protein E (SpoIIE) [compost metagenome]